ncbi:hypothetical protein EJ08DRAFT_157793 [Tothia fuscella]|uniref:GAR domain-containing protein n=1 Tax=Tothia fuscella TaxID=1048955 RepID=A0A9P4U008_9PEZI|nr:hypothetical protein EJ08DRAFT_157793 [Tothia fuscella]
MASPGLQNDESHQADLLSAPPIPQLAPPSTPTRTSARESISLRWKSPVKGNRQTILGPTQTTPNLDEFQKILADERTSAGEKDLASRVVKAAEKLREWCEEIEQWGWSGCFACVGETHASDGRTLPPSAVKDFSGSILPEQVEKYETRLDQIDEELTALEVDELKEHVIGIHAGRSRPSSSYSAQSVSTLNLMDDFSLFVTETLIQTLPYHAKLKTDLRAWSTRLAVFGKVPSFLKGVNFVGDELGKAWLRLQYPLGPELSLTQVHALESKLRETRDDVKEQIAQVGSLLDNMLDMLEASDDQLPEKWIDDFESQEKEYTEWSFHATQKLFQLEMLGHKFGETKEELRDEIPDSSSADVPGEKKENRSVAGAGLVLSTSGKMKDEEPIRKDYIDEHYEGDIPAVKDNNEELDTGAVVAMSQSPLSAASSSGSQAQHNDFGEPLTDNGERHEKAVEITLSHIFDFEPSELVTQEPPKLLEHPLHVVANLSAEDNPRNSTSTNASLSLPAFDGEDSSAPGSPIDSKERPTSWVTQPSSPPSAFQRDTYHNDTNLENHPPQTPRQTDRKRDSISSITSSILSDDIENDADSPTMAATVRHLAQAPRPPLNFAMKKRRSSMGVNNADISRSVTSPFPDIDTIVTDLSIEASPTKPSKSPKSPSVPLEEQISTILESIPAPIRLRSGPAADASDVKPRGAQRTSSAMSNYTRRSATPSLNPRYAALPQITLAPAPKRESKDPDIKVYHLSQPGKDKPIKLHVRRVGENGERVMVRVGGGWADLGEYLRGYAEHHGRRAVSEGKVEVLGLTNTANDSVTPNPRRTSLVSSIGSSAFGGTTNNDSFADGSRSPTPSFPINITNADTPRNSADEISTPISAAAFGSAGSRRSLSGLWDGGDVSLAGPAAASKKGKGDLSEERKLWVESVVEQAKNTVLPGNRKVEFGDLGKKGGTRRLFLKGRGLLD